MKYYRGFVKEELALLELNNTDVDLLRWFLDFKDTGCMETTIVGGKMFYWINHSYIVSQLYPIVPISNPESVARRLRKMVSCGLMFKHIVKVQGGTRVYYRLNPEVYRRLLGEDGQMGLFDFAFDVDDEPLTLHPTEKSSVEGQENNRSGHFCAPHPTEESGDTRRKSRVNDGVVSDIYVVVTEARRDRKFLKGFNDFCVADDPEYRRRTAFLIIKNALKYQQSISDMAESLAIANSKGEGGNVSYLYGIFKNRFKNRVGGISPLGKPEHIQVEEYLSERLAPHREYIQHFRYDHERREVAVVMRNSDDYETLSTLQELCNQVIARDVFNETRIPVRFNFTVKNPEVKHGHQSAS